MLPKIAWFLPMFATATGAVVLATHNRPTAMPGSAGSVTTKLVLPPPLPDTSVPPPQPPKPVIDVVFALDTTGSMGGLLEGAKTKIWSIASRIAQGHPTPELRVGLIGYRDRGDAYVTTVLPLTSDLDEVYARLQQFQAGGGGDTPEDVAAALQHAVEDMPWSEGTPSLKLLYVVGDAEPKRYGDVPSAEDWSRQALQRGITVSTVRCGKSSVTRRSFQRLAQLGGGAYFEVAQDGGMVATTTPYDAELKRLADEAARTSLHGGRTPAKKAARRRAERASSLAPAVAADRWSYFSLSGRGAESLAAPGSVDLAARPGALEELEADELPDELRDLDADERKRLVEQRAARRAEVAKKMKKVARERRQWLESRAGEGKGAVDDRIVEDVKERAATVGVRY